MKTGEKTKQILLNAGCRLFAEKGYYKTTMRDITEAANTNVAAVNYHFGGKENLYFEAYKHAAEVEQGLIIEKSKGSLNPQDLLEQTIYVRLIGLTNKSATSWLMRMFHHEVITPTALHDKILMEVMLEQREKLKVLVKEFFETDISEGQFDVIFSCFLSPMLHQLHRGERIEHHKKVFPTAMLDDLEDEKRIQMITTYIISGLEGLKKDLQNEKK